MHRLAAVVLLVFSASSLAARSFTVRYDLQSTDLPAGQTEALLSFLDGGRNSYYLLQGFACDTGGFQVSLKIADQRARKAHVAALRSISEDRLRVALPRVIPGEPRTDHRMLTLTEFATLEELERARDTANNGTALAHRDHEPLPTTPETTARTSSWWRLAAVLLLVLAAVAAWWLFSGQTKQTHRKHRLSAEEAQAVAAITGEPPVTLRRPAPRKGPVQPQDIIDFRSTTMAAAKKKTAKPGPTIRKALDKAFETKSLSEIARSPVHALQGLTPRHSKMLEEAFGVRTVEDLAALRYFELARAITVLARYEE